MLRHGFYARKRYGLRDLYMLAKILGLDVVFFELLLEVKIYF
jgi:hypothetical protein